MEFVDGKNKHPITKKYNYVRILEIKKHALTTTFSFSFKIPQTCLQAFIIFLTIEKFTALKTLSSIRCCAIKKNVMHCFIVCVYVLN